VPEKKPEDERTEVGVEDPPAPIVYRVRVDGSDVFSAAGAIPFEAPADEIFRYVEERARDVGTRIKRNRGKPNSAKIENMLSVEEKAVVILGRAIRIPWREIIKRISDDRVARGETPPSRLPSDFHKLVMSHHKKIVAAIHSDMLEGVEAYSPLVGSPGRIIWRAKLLEFYRQRIFALGRNTNMKLERKERRIASLDKAMEKHMRYFEGLQKEGDVELLMGSLSEKVQARAREGAEEAIAKKFANGEITDEERIDELRKLRHGELE